jgi:aryl-alcohol dehydrogenase-like predicted oxidoreductase
MILLPHSTGHQYAQLDWARTSGHFDLSPLYGNAEHVLGLALKGRRDTAMVATKVWTDTATEVRDQAKCSLAFFGGRIELYQIHNLLNWKECCLLEYGLKLKEVESCFMGERA